MKQDTKVAIGICISAALAVSALFLAFDAQLESLDSQHTLYSGTLVSDNATDGIAHIVLSNSTGYWNVSCNIAYHGNIPSQTAVFHYKVVVPSAPSIVIGIQKGQYVTIDAGPYGCKVS